MNDAELKAHWATRRAHKPPPAPVPAAPPEPPTLADALHKAAEDPDFSAREAQCIALRILGHSHIEIAEALGITKQVVANYLYNARKKAKLKGELDNLLAYKAAPLALDGLIRRLESDDPQMILETLKGLGYFRNHSQVKSEGGTGGVNLQVIVELPPGVNDVHTIPHKGQIVGTPRALLSEGLDDA